MGKFARWSAPEGLSLLAAWTRAGCSAGEIARRCGYSDQHYFSYCFKKYSGTSPVALRRSRTAGAQA